MRQSIEPQTGAPPEELQSTKPEALLQKPPVWGTLAGIRPAKVAEKLLVSGKGENAVIETLKEKYHVTSDRAALCTETAQAAIRLRASLTPRDVALYIGIPFCPTRCAYCSFVSNSVEKSFNLIEPFVDTLLQEIEKVAELASEAGFRIIAAYIGGGTPTSLPQSALEAIMAALSKSFDLSGLREYTVEAGRPDTVTASKLEIITKMGATRVCINPQSMSDEVLAAIGRAHTSKDVYHAAELVSQTGAALNMDIIAGLPYDTPAGFRKTLDAVLGFKPENITVHTLSLKKGSKIMLESTEIPSGADVGQMLDYSSHTLRECGYAPYYIYRQKYISGGFENTGWSLPGYEGIYNSCMMDELCTVLALGGGGVTKLVTADGKIERIFNAKYPREYIMLTEKMKDKLRGVRKSAISV